MFFVEGYKYFFLILVDVFALSTWIYQMKMKTNVHIYKISLL